MDQERIEPVLDQFSINVPEAQSYGVTFNSTHVCLSATLFTEEEDTQELLEYFVGEEEIDIVIPEIFDDVDQELSFVSVSHDGSEYVYFAMEYSADSTYEATDTLTLQLQYIYNYFPGDLSYYKYYGECSISDEVYEFMIHTEYNRTEYEDFTVTIQIDQDYNVLDWVLLLDSDAGCEDIMPPLGISSLEPFLVEECGLEYIYSSDQDDMVLDYEKSYFYPPDFAIAPNVQLVNNIGVIVIDFQAEECGYEIIGLWEYLTYEIELTVYDNNDTRHMEANGVFKNLDEISVTVINEDFYVPLFPEDDSFMIATYEPEPDLLTELLGMVIDDPHIQLYFEPDVSYNIYGLYDGNSAEVLSGRVEGVVETVIHRFSSNEDLIANGYEIIKNDIYYSSTNIDIEVYFKMTSMFDSDRDAWTSGLIIDTYIEFNDFCELNDFCGLLQKHAVPDDEEILQFSAEVINNTALVSYYIANFELSEEVEFQEVGLTLDASQLSQLPVFIGAFYLAVDSDSVLRFEGTIGQGQDNIAAAIKADSTSQWKTAFDISTLTVLAIFLEGTVNSIGEIIESVSRGNAFLGTHCYEGTSTTETCLEGSIKIIFDFDDYIGNSYELALYNLSTIDFYNFVLGFAYENTEEIVLPQSCLEFPAGILLSSTFESEILMTGYAMFCGVYGEVSGTITEIGGSMDINVTLDDFYLASENSRMVDSLGVLSVTHDESEASASISGTLNIWGLETETTFIISSMFFSEFSGAIYKSIYSYNVQLRGLNSSKITEADFIVNMQLLTETLKDIESYTRTELEIWTDSGYLTILESNEKLAQFTRELGEYESLVCDPELVCPEEIYCTDTIEKVCIENPLTQNCLGGTGCNNVQLACTSFEVICVKKDCDDCDCIVTVELCKKWESECLEDSDECKDKIIEKDEACLESLETCTKEKTLELECQRECEWNQELYEDAKNSYEVFVSAYNLTLEEIIGFEELNNLIESNLLIEDLVRFTSVGTERELDSSGIGPYDFNFTSVSQVVSIEKSNFVDYSMDLEWNFFDENANFVEFIKKSKNAIIDLSGDTLTEELKEKSALEVLEENVDYSKV